MNKITVIGAGYVGIATTLALASENNRIDLIESNKDRYQMLKDGYCPINEVGMQDRLNKVHKYLKVRSHMRWYDANSSIIFVCVGTPTMSSGDLDLKYINSVVDHLAMTEYEGLVIIKSTLNLGDVDKISAKYPNLNIAFSPEFLRESTALMDAMNPDRIILGFGPNIKKDAWSGYRRLLEGIYYEALSENAFNNCKFLYMDSISAELVKLASNSYLALRLTYFNELSMLCQNTDANIKDVISGMVLDPRIGSKYATTSIGYAGPCLPKDTLSLAKYADLNGAPLRSLVGAINSNSELFNQWMNYIRKLISDYQVESILVLGVAFKDYSDDIRTSLTCKIIGQLAMIGLEKLDIHDPRCNEEAKLDKSYDMIIISSKEYANLCSYITSKVIVDLRNCTEGFAFNNVKYLGQ